MTDQADSNQSRDDSAPLFDARRLSGLPVIGTLADRLFGRGPRVAVLRLSGVIGDMGGSYRRPSLSYARLSRVIEKTFGVRNLRAVALVINSPGGAPAQASLIAGMIRDLADEKDVTVHAFVEDVAASGGYWLACAADRIYAQDCSIVGSIGVISAGFGLDKTIGKIGMTRRLYTAGRDKSMLDPFSPERSEDVDRLRDMQADIHGHFIDWVRMRRGDSLRGADSELFEGRFWTAGPALDLGLIDGIGDVRSTMRDLYGNDVKLVDMNAPPRFTPPFMRAGMSSGLDTSELADGFLNAVEDRAHWSRFGL